MTHVVHPELLLEAGLSCNLAIDPTGKLGFVLLGQVSKLDEEQGECGQSLLTVHNVDSALDDVRYVCVEVVPRVVTSHSLLARIEVTGPPVLLAELVEHVVEQPKNRFVGPAVVSLVEIYEVRRVREDLVKIL